MTEQELLEICKFMLDETGIVLTSEKRYLVEHRLHALMREFALPSLGAIAREVRGGNRTLRVAVIDALSTHETLFFRDRLPFEAMARTLFPALMERRPRGTPLRIWSAACSTGQEPYSIVMMLDELRQKGLNIGAEIVATDVASKVIEQATAAVFSQFEVQRGLPIKHLLTYFTQEGTRWRLKPEYARQVQFRTHNLLGPPPRMKGPCDIILCRNALIYFGDGTKRRVLQNLASALAEDGYLVLGSAETVLGAGEAFTMHPVEPGVYVKKTAPEAMTRPSPPRMRAAVA